MLTPRHARLAFAGVFLISAVAFLLPGSATPDAGIPGSDKLAHFALFATLGALARLSWPQRRALLFGALATYGLAIELTQSIVPGRSPEALDWLADALGAALGLLLTKRAA